MCLSSGNLPLAIITTICTSDCMLVNQHGVLLGVLSMLWCTFARSFTSKKPLLSTGAKGVFLSARKPLKTENVRALFFYMVEEITHFEYNRNRFG